MLQIYLLGNYMYVKGSVGTQQIQKLIFILFNLSADSIPLWYHYLCQIIEATLIHFFLSILGFQGRIFLNLHKMFFGSWS